MLPGYTRPGGAVAWWCILLCGIPTLLMLLQMLLFSGSSFGLALDMAVEFAAISGYVLSPVLAAISIIQAYRAKARLTFLHLAPLSIVVILFGLAALTAMSMSR